MSGLIEDSDLIIHLIDQVKQQLMGHRTKYFKLTRPAKYLLERK